MSVSPSQDDGLRDAVTKSGVRLLARQAAGLVLSVGGILAITRAIGPAQYGVYSAAFGLAFFAQTTAELSLDVYLVRYPGDLPSEVCDQVFTLLLLFAVLAVAFLLGIATVLSQLVRLPGFTAIAIVMFASLPVVHLQQVPLSMMERSFNYRPIGVIELSAQASYFVAALPLAFVFHSAWAPVAGWWLQQLLQLGGFWRRGGYRPHLIWRRTLVADAVKYGFVTNGANLIYSLRNLVNPILVSRLLGASAVGYVALALRLATQLGFVQTVVSRISLAVLGRIAADRARLQRALTQALELQLLAFGVPVTCFCIVAAVVIPLVFGHQWRPAASLFPLLAPSYMALSMFSPLISALSLQKRPWGLLASQGANAALLWVGAAIFVPAVGLRGYGLAELLTIPSWLIADYFLARDLPRPRYRYALSWWGTLSLAALAPVTTWWLLVGLPLGFGTPFSLREMVRLYRSFSGATRSRSHHEVPGV